MRSVCVIGGGPGGSLAALLLARAGVVVRLIEQHRFPRDKVCGECVSALGWEVLERVGLAERVRRAGAVRMGRGVVSGVSGKSAELELPGGMWGISRAVFDLVLLEAAKEAGVEVWQPARCERVGDAIGLSTRPHPNPLPEGEGIRMLVRDLEKNERHTLDSDVVILADGKGVKDSTADFGIKAHFELKESPRDAVQLFGCRGCYAGVAPIEGGLFNIACSVPRERIERCRDIQAVFEEMVGENRGLAEVMGGGKRVTQWMGAPLPRFGVRRDWPAGVIPIGNAAAALEPIGGEGMGLALRSGEMAAEAVAEMEKHGRHGHGTQAALALVQRRLQGEFAQLWRWRRVVWRGVAMMVSRPVLCELAVDVMNVTNVGERLVHFARGMGAINESGSLQ